MSRLDFARNSQSCCRSLYNTSATTRSSVPGRCLQLAQPRCYYHANNAVRTRTMLAAVRSILHRPLRSLIPPLLSGNIPGNQWGVALADPALMMPVALRSGLPNLLLHAPSMTRSVAWARASVLPHLPRFQTRQCYLPTRTQIDARLRRSMETALHSYSTSAASVRVVLVNGLQICGKNLPYMLGIALADTFHNLLVGPSRCLAPVSAPINSDLPAVDLRVGSLTWPEWAYRVWTDLCETARTLAHVAYLIILFTPLALCAPLALSYDIGRQAWMVSLRETLEVAGPAFIKWGQWAATRQDMFPPDLCEQLSLLQSSAPSHSYAFTKKTLEDSFGSPVHELLDWIDESPLASGSVGQIHCGKLSQRGAEVCGMTPGTVVAIKVKHPNVSESIQRDFGLMMFVVHHLESFEMFRKLRLKESLQQFAAPLREQVDLTLEANNLWRFNRNFSKDERVSLPMPLYPWVSQDVLMQTFEEGMHISEYMVLDSDTERRAAVAGVGSHCMLNMMLVHNLIHSDLHPGNILVRWQLPSGWLVSTAAHVLPRLCNRPAEQILSQWLQPHVVLLDVGMATELSTSDQYSMWHLFKGFVEKDGVRMADAALSFAGKRQHCVDPEGFKLAIAKRLDDLNAVETWDETGYQNSAEAFSSILNVIREYEVTLPGHICAVLVTTLVLEGWSSELAPDHSVLEQVRTVVAMDTKNWRERLNTTVDNWMSWAPVLPMIDAA